MLQGKEPTVRRVLLRRHSRAALGIDSRRVPEQSGGQVLRPVFPGGQAEQVQSVKQRELDPGAGRPALQVQQGPEDRGRIDPFVPGQGQRPNHQSLRGERGRLLFHGHRQEPKGALHCRG